MCDPTRIFLLLPVVKVKKPLGKKKAFTLFELLLAMGIFLILAGLTIGLTEGLQRRSARTKAIGQLALLAEALESYKTHYGDYPWIGEGSDGANEIYAALIGNRGPMAGYLPHPDGSGRLVSGSAPLAGAKGRHFIELSQFQTANKPTPSNARPLTSLDQGVGENFLLDPWGVAYVYRYRKIGENPNSGDWKRPGFLLMSFGPDGAVGTPLPQDGILTSDYHENEQSRDNIFALP